MSGGQDDNRVQDPQGSRNARPADLTRLLFQGDIHPTWNSANKTANRFYVLNLSTVLDKLGVEHTKVGPQFLKAAERIAKQTPWPSQFRFAKWSASHIQINPTKKGEAKQFPIAAAIIVAMEIIAEESASSLNVYDYLRIIPAQYYADRFDKTRLNALTAHFNGLSAEQKTAQWGEDAGLSFEDLCLKSMGQEYCERLLEQMASGYCATRYVVQKLCDAINVPAIPSNLHIGPIRSAGEDNAIIPWLGTKNAADSLRVPKNRTPDELPPCF